MVVSSFQKEKCHIRLPLELRQKQAGCFQFVSQQRAEKKKSIGSTFLSSALACQELRSPPPVFPVLSSAMRAGCPPALRQLRRSAG